MDKYFILSTELGLHTPKISGKQKWRTGNGKMQCWLFSDSYILKKTKRLWKPALSYFSCFSSLPPLSVNPLSSRTTPHTSRVLLVNIKCVRYSQSLLLRNFRLNEITPRTPHRRNITHVWKHPTTGPLLALMGRRRSGQKSAK